MIDRIRHDIQERVEQLLVEAEKLRRALAALDPREKSTRPEPRPPARNTPARATSSGPRSGVPRRGASASGAARSSRAGSASSPQVRTAPGATKAKVLAALSADRGMTAGEVASATGLGRATISTTLSKLAKAGEVSKADRGYKLPARKPS